MITKEQCHNQTLLCDLIGGARFAKKKELSVL